MKDQTREEPKIVAAAERQMQAWAHVHSTPEQAPGLTDAPGKKLACGPYLSLSREAGAGASEVAQRVGEALGWQVLDRNLLDEMAAKFHTQKDLLEFVDETQASWAYDVLGTWMDRALVTHEKYVAQLGRLLLAHARKGRVVFVGRGTPFLLPRSGGLAVRLVAPVSVRVQRIMRTEGLPEREARARIEKTDHGRKEFVQRYFHHNIDDAHLYDMVLNTGRFGIDAVVAIILDALKPWIDGQGRK